MEIGQTHTVFPALPIVHGPCHVFWMVNRAIDERRREMVFTLSDEDRCLQNGSRFLLLRGLENLSPTGLVS